MGSGKKLIPVLLVSIMAAALFCGCETTHESKQEAHLEVTTGTETEVKAPDNEETDDDEFVDFDEEDTSDESATQAASEASDTEDNGSGEDKLSYLKDDDEEINENYNIISEAHKDLTEFYESAEKLYHSDEIPQDDAVEENLRNAKELMDNINNPDDWKNYSDEDRVNTLKFMSDITQKIQDTINSMYSLKEEHTVNADDLAILDKNMEVVYNNYNMLVDYFNQEGVSMTDWQRSQMQYVYQEIDELQENEDNRNIETQTELTDYNNDILKVIGDIDAIYNSI